MIPSERDRGVRAETAGDRRAVFVVAATPALGLGHVYRAAMVAQQLADVAEVLFVCTSGSDLGQHVLGRAGLSAVVQPSDRPLADVVLGLRPCLVVNDFLDTPAAYVKELKRAGAHVVSFEDEGSGARHCHLVINALFLGKESQNQYRYGPNYFCLRDEFLNTPASAFRPRVENVLITFGGTDAPDSTGRLVELLAADGEFVDLRLIVITGPGYLHRHRLLDRIGRLDQGAEVTWIEKTRRIATHMRTADVAFSSAGRTVFELAAMRVPAIVLAANRKEERHEFAASTAGFIYLGRHDLVTDEHILDHFRRLLRDAAQRRAMNAALARIDLQHGKERVVAEIRALLTTRSDVT